MNVRESAALRWCVAQTKPREEEVAVMNLLNQGMDCFRPLLREHSGKDVKLVTMFPRYIFVEINPCGELWPRINGTRGVRKVLMSDGLKPALLPQGWVEELRELGGVMDRFLDAFTLKKGDMVEFTEGALAGQLAKVEWSKGNRVAVLMHLLNRETVVYSENRALKLVPVNA